jgi:hypothetical protein
MFVKRYPHKRSVQGVLGQVRSDGAMVWHTFCSFLLSTWRFLFVTFQFAKTLMVRFGILHPAIFEQQLIWSNLVQKGFYVHLTISQAPLKEPTPGKCICRELMPPRPSENNFALVQFVFEVLWLTFVGLVAISRFGGGAPTRRVVGNCYLLVGQCLNILD